jgi:hypothetical protein
MVVLGMTFGGIMFAAGMAFAGVLMLIQAQFNPPNPMPTCPGNVISAEYHKDGVMLCRYQQEPIGMKTYKQQVK